MLDRGCIAIRNDDKLGYFGILPASLFARKSEIRALGVSPFWPVTSGRPLTNFLWFAALEAETVIEGNVGLEFSEPQVGPVKHWP